MGSGRAFALLLVLLTACGGKADDIRNGYDGSSGGANVGGESGLATGGLPSTGGCTASPVTFQAIGDAGSAGQWCLGPPGLTNTYAELRLENASGPIATTSEGIAECARCSQTGPSPEPPGVWDGVKIHSATAVWDACYFVSSQCPGQAEACTNMISAPAGTYAATLCGFVNPNPEWSGGCEEAPDSTPTACVKVEFDYPTQAPVLVRMPAS